MQEENKAWYENISTLIVLAASALTALIVLFKYIRGVSVWTYRFILLCIKNTPDTLRLHIEETRVFHELSPDLWFVLDADGNCERISKSFLQFFDRTESEIVQQNWKDVIADESLAEVERRLAESYKQLKGYNFANQMILTRSGDRVKCHVIAKPILNLAGTKVEKLCGVVKPIAFQKDKAN